MSRHLAHLVDDVVDLASAGHGRTSTGGSIRPVGRITCSVKTPPVCSISQGPGVAETYGGLRPHRLPLLELERAVVEAGGQAEAVFGEGELAAVVAAVHAADLRHGLVALVDEQQGVVGDVFEEGRRRLAGAAAGEVAAVVLDAGAGAGGLDHLHVEGGALFQPLGLQQLAVGDQPVEALLQLLLDGLDRLVERRARRHVVAVGVDLHAASARRSSCRSAGRTR